jgi:arylsulfatase A-like enzyme
MPAIVRSPRLGSLWEGIALGASLAAAEIVVGYLSGGWFSARWWPVLIAFDLAVGALAGLLASRVAPAFVVLAFACATLAVNQEALPGRARLSPLPIAAAVFALAASVASARVVGKGKGQASLSLPFFLVAGLALAGRTVPAGGLGAVIAYLGLTFACVTAGGWLVGVAARRVSARAGLVALAAAAVVIAAAGASGLTGPRAGRPDFRDLPQPAAGPGRGTRASVVLVVLDSVRAASVSAYGYPSPTTPRIDALARDGILFADALTPAPWTVPAHASLFTGLTPSRHGAGVDEGGNLVPLDAGQLSLAEILAAEGYATAGISANRAVSGTFGLDQGFRYFDSLPDRDHGFAYQPLVRRVEGRLGPWVLDDDAPLARWLPRRNRGASEISERARRWLGRGHRPFFLFLNYMEAHSPQGPEPRVAYDLALRSLDEELGRLLDEVRAQPGGDEAWIVVTADHGESLGEHGLGHGCGLHQEVLHVPLIVRPPRSLAIPRGTVDRRPTMLTDVLPLLLDGLGLPTPAGLDGQLPGAARPFRIAEAVFPPLICRPRPGEGRPRQAIVDGRFKLILVEGGGADELYDRGVDPAEAHNVVAARAEEAARLRDARAAWTRSARAARGRSAPAPDPEREQRLRALGYLR